MFCYGLFDTFKAMKYVKYFILYNAVGDLAQVILNFLLFDESNYKIIFVVFLMTSFASFLIHY